MKIQKTAQFSKYGQDFMALFIMTVDGEEVWFPVGAEDYDALGRPQSISVTFEPLEKTPGLPSLTEEQAASLPPVESVPAFDVGKAEEIHTEADDIEDGFDMAQCSIRHPHATHTWTRAHEPHKPLMCEGI